MGRRKLIIYGVAVGGFAGYRGGLLGVGGNLIVPAFVWLGFDPKKASSTNSFIVIFSSFSGFLGYISVGNIAPYFLVLCAIGSIAFGLFGNYLMRKRLTASQVKKVIGIVLYIFMMYPPLAKVKYEEMGKVF